ncbi:hypothetical protein GQX74_012930 [Glossina fuscipes]|nr:hypothetical protein GQX74_012930 [Glossina fuscipes]
MTEEKQQGIAGNTYILLVSEGGGGSWVNLFLVQLVETAQWPNTHNVFYSSKSFILEIKDRYLLAYVSGYLFIFFLVIVDDSLRRRLPHYTSSAQYNCNNITCNNNNTNTNGDLMRVEGLSHASSACLILLNMCGE